MSFSMVSFLIVLTQVLGLVGLTPEFRLPEEWTKEFSIDLYSGGGMQDRSTSIEFTYDSSKYISRDGAVKKITAFALTSANRAEILKKLHELNVDDLRIVETGLTQDKESTSICFQYKTEFCLSDGAATELRKGDEKNFSEAWRYLTDFALRKK